MFIQGLKYVAHELAVILLLWGVVSFVWNYLIARTLRGADFIETSAGERRRVFDAHARKVKGIGNVAINTVAVLALVSLFFFYSPFERPADELPDINPVQVDPQHEAATGEEIRQLNIERPAAIRKEVKQQATTENLQAMTNAIGLFRKAAGSTD